MGDGRGREIENPSLNWKTIQHYSLESISQNGLCCCIKPESLHGRRHSVYFCE